MISRRAVGLLLGIGAVCLGTYAVWRLVDDGLPDPEAIPHWDEVVVSGDGWAEGFETDSAQALTEYDPRWVPIFGRLLMRPDFGAVIGHPGQEDGSDDYAFLDTGRPLGDVEITLDTWWAGDWHSVGAEGVVQPEPPHRLYEAALWKGKLWLIYARGPTSGDWEALAESEPLDVAAGFYRLVFRNEHDAGTWTLIATLQDRTGKVVGRLTGTDDRLPASGYQGVGILGGSSSFITGIAVRGLP